MILSKRPALTLPRIWIVAADKNTVRVFEKSSREHPLFDEVFSAPFEDTGRKLDESLRCNALDRLVLAGTRKILDRLYGHLDKSIYARVMAEIPKDLLGLNNGMLQKELAAIVWF